MTASKIESHLAKRLNTYSFYDFGMRPAYQCTLDALSYERALEQAETDGLYPHRLSGIIGVYVLVLHIPPGTLRENAVYDVTPKFHTRHAALSHYHEHLYARHHEHHVLEYAYPVGDKFDLLAMPKEAILDIESELSLYGVL